MNPVLIEVLKQIIIAVAGITIVGATVATGTMGASNLVSKFTEKEHTIAQVQAETESADETGTTDTAEVAGPSTTVKNTVKPTSIPSPTKKIGGTAAVVSSVSPTTPASNTATGCIITLFGQQYNISTLLQSHSGGNIFTCGTDMTSTYQGKHGSSVSRMQKYLVSTIGTGGTIGAASGATGTSAATGIQHDDDEDRDDDRDEDDEHEDEKREEEMKKVFESAKKELEHEDD